MSDQDYPGDQDAQYVDECRYWKAKADESEHECELLRNAAKLQRLVVEAAYQDKVKAEAALDTEREELHQLREVVGVRGDVKSFASDRDHWCRLMDNADKVVRLEAALALLRECRRYIDDPSAPEWDESGVYNSLMARLIVMLKDAQ